MSPRRAAGGLAFLNDRAAFVRRFVLAEVLAPPRGLVVRLPRGRRVEAKAPVVGAGPKPR